MPDGLGSNVVGMFDIDVEHVGAPLKQGVGAISNLLKRPAFLPKQVAQGVGNVGSSTVSILIGNVAVRLVRDLFKVLNQFGAFCVNVKASVAGGALQPGIC